MWKYNKEPIERIVIPISQMKDRFQKLIDDYKIRDLIEETRNKILNAYKVLEFKEETHQYFYKGKELIPVSNVVDMFVPITNFNKVAKKYAETNGKTEKYWRTIWNLKGTIATTSGSLTHLFGETICREIWNEKEKNCKYHCKKEN